MSAKPIVTVREGKIRGIKKQSPYSGVEYYSFFGVPYGQSTAKWSRFKDPVKARPWKNILDATIEKEGCTQYNLRFLRIAGTEDCLYNNIHTPKLPSKGDSMKAVVFNIHAGGYIHGSPEPEYFGSPDYVMHRDIVYICVSYRLHVLGFLDLELEQCSGNQALKDMILSLKWIKDNISTFGGDPNNITLLGSSSGGAAVHCLLLSPAAKGLFHKAIMMGGYIFNPLLNIPKNHFKFAIELARLNNYNTTNMDETAMSTEDKKRLLAYLKKMPLDFRILKSIKMQSDILENFVSAFPSPVFSETVDKGENVVFPVHCRKLIESMPRIPLLVGICEKEAVMAFFKKLKPTNAIDIDPFYKSYKQNYFGWGYNVSDDEYELIKEKINSFYLEGNSLEYACISKQVDIQSDAAFFDIYDTLLDITASDLPSSVYIYKFQFEGNALSMKPYIQGFLQEPVEGTYHAADFSYWAPITGFMTFMEMLCEPLSPESVQMVEIFTKLLSTFAKTGNPNYDESKVLWKPSTPEKPCYLKISDELQMVDGKLNGKGMEFWQDLKNQFYKEE